MYGRDARLPTQAALSPPPQHYPVDATDYRAEFTSHMSEKKAWELARTHIVKAQKHQKKYYDQKARMDKFLPGDQVFVHMPSARSGPAWKLARPFHGPFHVLDTFNNGVEVRPVDQPNDKPIRVALQRIRRCPIEMPDDQFYPRKKNCEADPSSRTYTENIESRQHSTSAAWANRLCSRGRGRPSSQAREM